MCVRVRLHLSVIGALMSINVILYVCGACRFYGRIAEVLIAFYFSFQGRKV